MTFSKNATSISIKQEVISTLLSEIEYMAFYLDLTTSSSNSWNIKYYYKTC